MNIYRLRFSIRTSQTTVHSDTCTSAAFYLKPTVRENALLTGIHKSGDSLWQVRAESAQAVKEAQDKEFIEEKREMPAVKVCACCKGT